MFEFDNPWFLLLFLLIPLAIVWDKRWGSIRQGTIQISSIEHLKKISSISGSKKIKRLNIVYLIILSLIITAMAKPRAILDLSETSVNIVDINSLTLSAPNRPLVFQFDSLTIKQGSVYIEPGVRLQPNPNIDSMTADLIIDVSNPMIIKYITMQDLDFPRGNITKKGNGKIEMLTNFY